MERKINTQNNLKIPYNGSRSINIKRQLLDNLGANETSKLLLLLSVLASYYVNSEKITKNSSLFFVKSLEDIYLGNKNEVPNYIKLHMKTYDKVFFTMRKIIDNKGNLRQGESVWKVLDIIKNDLFSYESFRTGVVVHGEGAKLKKKYKHIDISKKIYNSNFIFPPADYISSLIKRLDEKLKDKNVNVYKKAAYIGTYIFLTHPFEDGNSRSSRIAMVSYLDRLSKDEFKFFTFIANFSKALSEENYLNFLKENVYSEFNKFRFKVKLDNQGNILEYLSLEEYEQIIEKVANKLYKRIIKVYKNIIYQKSNIYIFARYIQEYLSIKNEKQKDLFRGFLLNLFDSIEKNGIENIEEFIKNFSFSKKFKKKRFYLNYEDYKQFYEHIKSILADLQK